MQENELYCSCCLHCIALNGWESMVGCLGEESGLRSPQAFCALSPLLSPTSTLDRIHSSSVIRHCQIFAMISSVACVGFSPAKFFAQKLHFMVLISYYNLFHIWTYQLCFSQLAKATMMVRNEDSSNEDICERW